MVNLRSIVFAAVEQRSDFSFRFKHTRNRGRALLIVQRVFVGIKRGSRASLLTCTFVRLEKGVPVVRPVFAMNLARSGFFSGLNTKYT